MLLFSFVSFLTFAGKLTKLKSSMGKLEVVINLLKSEQVAQKNNMQKAKSAQKKIKDENSKEFSDTVVIVGEIEVKQASIDAQIRNLEFAKAESLALKTAAETFSTQLTTVPNGGRSIFMEMVLQEQRKNVDFVLDAAVVGAGGEGYIDRRWFSSTKLSVLTGVNIRFELINKEGIVVKSGMVGEAYSASYKLRKPEKIKVKKAALISAT